MSTSMRDFAFTVDLDRDANEPLRGEVCSISRDRGQGCQARHLSSAEGLSLLVELLDELGVKATFFAESWTLSKIDGVGSLLHGHEVASHGVHHEDLTAKDSGVSLDDEQLHSILRRSRDEIEDIIGCRPLGFRAPYMHIDERVTDHLAALGFRYDSSYTCPMEDGVINAFRLPCGLCEFPVASALDSKGKKIVSYFWPLHEGKRPVEDYLHLIDSLEEGILVTATHTWHVAESIVSGRLSKEATDGNILALRRILEHAQDRGMRCGTLASRLDAVSEDR